MNLKRKKILVTGADGFIGSHLTERLAQKGHRVRAFVYYNSFNSWGWLEGVESRVRRKLDIVSGDVRDLQSVEHAVKGCDVVLHLAALIAIPYSYHAPDSYVETNVRGTLNILQAARRFGVQKVVHTSTSEVYGNARFTPIREDHPLQPQSPYAATKIAADQLALSFFHSYGTPVAVLRPFNTYGPRQSARAVIPTIITQIASGRRSLRLGALTPTRDFSYIDDTVNAFVATAASDAALGQVVHTGSGHEISIGETAREIARILRVSVRIEADRERLRPEKSEVWRLLADNTKAREVIGWKPAYAGREGFKKGLTKTIQWFTQAKNLSRYKADLCNL